jgi:hypothetical protein
MLGKMTSRPKFAAGIAGTIAAAISVMGASSSAFAQSANQPSGTVRLQIVQASFIGSASKGGGVLNFQGHDYKFTTTGGGIGGFGLSKFEAAGAVYGLKSVADFSGPYIQLRTGMAVGDLGKGKMWLGNPHGVSMGLSGRRKGLALSLGADALVVSFAK